MKLNRREAILSFVGSLMGALLQRGTPGEARGVADGVAPPDDVETPQIETVPLEHSTDPLLKVNRMGEWLDVGNVLDASGPDIGIGTSGDGNATDFEIEYLNALPDWGRRDFRMLLPGVTVEFDAYMQQYHTDGDRAEISLIILDSTIAYHTT